jgi:hypothetical protein
MKIANSAGFKTHVGLRLGINTERERMSDETVTIIIDRKDAERYRVNYGPCDNDLCTGPICQIHRAIEKALKK